MFYLITVANIIIFVVISAIHFYWVIVNREFDLQPVIPHINGKPVFIPTRLGGSFIATLLLGASVLIYLNADNILSFIPDTLYKIALGVLSAIMFLRAVGEFRLVGFFKKIKDSKFAEMDTKYYSPLCLYLCISCLYLVLKN
ncbi:MAG: DUF3995 domain-containing protein [Proteobacteria bacterium]|nr:DUF3995 domain-containing protein [Pseudomonadota bacterium]MBU1582024.1 DUF3995 domain-containing protein [Pseudomonadota bacterium]MBU2456215.1 DUF3995 domain-containing protein [Pseudomonadota bacterium]MBU2632043.1 DUF3995 domain-containing protein [Pseudomonadota bacterium]